MYRLRLLVIQHIVESRTNIHLQTDTSSLHTTLDSLDKATQESSTTRESQRGTLGTGGSQGTKGSQWSEGKALGTKGSKRKAQTQGRWTRI